MTDFDIVYRLLNPPFGTETSERNLMKAGADVIQTLRGDNQEIMKINNGLREALLSARLIIDGAVK